MQKPSDPDSQAQKTRPDMPPIFALTIGIDEYLHQGEIIKNLSGCVADVEDMEAFLTQTLCVPSGNITTLRNQKATAAEITHALKSLALASNDKIPKGAIIFIFYAGHGSQVATPKNLNWNRPEIQMLLPYDFSPSSSVVLSSRDPVPGDMTMRSIDAAPTSDLVAMNGLADIKLGQLFEDIAKEKGNNITVVFDCCHSGSGTRSQGSTGNATSVRTARGVNLPRGTRLSADAFPDSRGSQVPDKDKSKGLASHVLLAACKESQCAYERSGRGVFTSALTKLLRSEDLQQVTYSEIIDSLSSSTLIDQHPQCEGNNRHLVFLRNHAASNKRTVFNLVDKGDGQYEINGGEAHGVTDSAEFAIYDSKACTNAIGCCVVYKADSFKAALRPLNEGQPLTGVPEEGAFAVQTRIGITRDVSILVESSDKLASIFTDISRCMREEDAAKPSFKCVATKEENPDLIVTDKEDGAHFEITDRACLDAGLKEVRLHSPTDRESLTSVLRGVTDFFWNLHRTASGKRMIGPMIRFSCYELKQEYIGDDLLPVMQPTGSDLFVDGKIHIAISAETTDKCYGFSVENKSAVLLFLSVFYFNMSDLSIVSYYESTTAGSLPARDTLTIGYGSGGSPPYSYYLEKGQAVDVGYIKLFLSTEYVDHHSVPQKSPFHSGGRNTVRRYFNPNLWDTMIIPVIQSVSVGA